MSEETIDFLGGLDETPAPPPKPNSPAPAKVTLADVVAAPASSPWRLLEYVAIGLVSAALAGGYVAWKLGGRGDGPSPAADVVADGRVWAKELPLTFADSFEKAQAEVRGTDKPMSKIRSEHVERWKASREAAFDNRFERAFDAVISNGNDNPTMEDRRRYAEVMGDVIKGTREGAK